MQVGIFRNAIHRAVGLAGHVAVASRVGMSTLRVLAYHAVPDAASFERQVGYLIRHFNLITARQAVAVIARNETIDRPLWITFDDGDSSIVERGLAALNEFDVSATLFVCPGMIDSTEPFWWEVIEMAIAEKVELEGRLVAPGELSRLKLVHDNERRVQVRKIGEALEDRIGRRPMGDQLTTGDLHRWIAAGNFLGNHTWDHPLLNMCEPQEQRQQIAAAHEWLTDNFSLDNLLFAYPNGNHSPAAEAILRELGYAVGVLFDHRVHRGRNPLQTSRIRVNSADGLSEFKAKVSGIHPVIHRALGRS